MSEPIEVTLDYYIKKCDKLEKKLAVTVEFIEECVKGPYKESDLASLSRWIERRASAILTKIESEVTSDN